jgi:LysM repeat protein
MRILALSSAVAISVLALTFSSPAAHAAPKKTSSKAAQKIITIQDGDSLSKLATTHGSTAQRLFDANLAIENPDLIFPGDKVRVPSSDEKLATRPMPVYAAPQPVTEAPAPVAATPSARNSAPQAAAPAVAGGSVWDQLAQCESGGNWAINTGNGFYGGLQFTLSSWQATGGSGLPSNASREEQIMRAERLLAMQGWGAWPACTSKLGLR